MSKKLKTFISLALSTLFIAACTGPNDTTWEYMYHMGDNIAVKAQKEPMRVPPVGTIPRGFTPYPYEKNQGDLAGASLSNPLKPTEEVFDQGQIAYNNFCSVCHGKTGVGDGSIVPKFPRPPTLLSTKVTDWSGGRIFHVITKGQNLMPSYAGQISPKDRWAIVYYVRALQRAGKPTEADVEALKKALRERRYP